MFKETKLAVAIGLMTMVGTSHAAVHAVDARSMSMGNTGVVSADYLTAPFHNPALIAVYREEDDFGMLLPAVGVGAMDKDDAITTIDDVQSLYDDLGHPPSQAELDELDTLLDELNGAEPVNVTGGVGLSIAIPNKHLAMNLYTQAQLELIAEVDVADDTLNPEDRYDQSVAALAGFGVAEVGLAIARKLDISGQDVVFGVTPKFQELRTYSEVSTLDDFDLEDYEDSETSESAFNLDLGVAWTKEEYRVGLAAKNLIKQELETMHGDHTYTLAPLVTLGAGYTGEYVTAVIDVDLTKQERFEFDGDDTQFARIGLEGNAWGWIQLRAGYEVDIQDNLDSSITAGFGISPFDVVSLDVAASYAGENQAAASANLAFTF